MLAIIALLAATAAVILASAALWTALRIHAKVQRTYGCEDDQTS